MRFCLALVAGYPPKRGIAMHLIFLLPMMLIGLIGLLIQIACLISVAVKPRDAGWKVVWALIIIFFPFLGCLIYILVGRKI
jgi:hypothetical protein